MFDALLAGHLDDRRVFLHLRDGTTLSHAEILAMSGRIANVLAVRGVRPGDRVAVQVQKSPQALAVYFACLRAGIVFLPLNTAYTPAEVEYFVGDAEVALLICDPKSESALRPVAQARGAGLATLGIDGSGSLMAEAAGQGADFATVPRGPDDLAAILYTSGTTGRSKGAMMSHRNLLLNAETLVQVWRFTADDVLMHALPIFHTHGLFVATNVCLAAGAAMIFLPSFDAEEVMRLLPRATAMMGVPTFYTRLLARPELTREAVAHMRLFISGSAPLLAETHDEFRARTGKPILERYGMTETNMLTSNPYDGDRRAGTVGFPLPGVELRIADPVTGKELPQGEVGMIEVRGPNVFRGYWRMPEKTREEFRPDGFFITGDLGTIDERGYVRIVGRGKDLIISGGYNVYPKEVEQAIDDIPEIEESAVIGVPHPDFGEGVVAVAVLRKGAECDEARVVASLGSKLARFKQPKRVFFVDELPRNTMGKVQKNVLRERYRDCLAG